MHDLKLGVSAEIEMCVDRAYAFVFHWPTQRSCTGTFALAQALDGQLTAEGVMNKTQRPCRYFVVGTVIKERWQWEQVALSGCRSVLQHFVLITETMINQQTRILATLRTPHSRARGGTPVQRQITCG